MKPVLSLLFVALTLGLAFAHVLELVGKLRLDGPSWLVVQQNLYVGFGPIGGTIEVLAILFTWLTLFGRRGSTRAWRWTLVAAIAVTAGLVEWALVVSPMNGVLSAWTPQSLPAEWTRVRDRWETGHAVQAVLFAIAFVALVVALQTEPRPVSGERP
jgi:hypothetical protein